MAATRASVLSLRGPEAVDRALFRADDEASTAHGRRRANGAVELNPLKFLAARQVEDVEPTVLRTDVHSISSDDGGAVDLAVSRDAPDFLASRAIERVDALVAAAGNDELLCDGDGREKRQLALRRFERPSDFRFCQIDREHLAAHRADVELVVAHSGGRPDLTAEIDRAEFFAVGGIQNMQRAVAPGRKGLALDEGRRAHHWSAVNRKLPADG